MKIKVRCSEDGCTFERESADSDIQTAHACPLPKTETQGGAPVAQAAHNRPEAGPIPAPATTIPDKAPAIKVQKSFAADWYASGRDPKRLELVGRHMAEKLGKPALAEQPIVRHASVVKLDAQDGAPADASMVLKCPTISNQEWNRNGEQVMQDGWELANYSTYPVLMLGHKYDGNPFDNVVGKAIIETLTKRPNLSASYDVMKDEDGKGRRLMALARFLGAVTVSPGFLPTEWEILSADDVTGEQFRYSRIRYLRQELLEVSVPTIPANAAAIAYAATNGLIGDDLKEFVREDATAPTVVLPPAAAAQAAAPPVSIFDASFLAAMQHANLALDLYEIGSGHARRK